MIAVPTPFKGKSMNLSKICKGCGFGNSPCITARNLVIFRARPLALQRQWLAGFQARPDLTFHNKGEKSILG